MISPNDFYKCFREVMKERQVDAISKYDTEFTYFMLGEKGVLESTLDKLKKEGLASSDLVSDREYYSVDMIYRARRNIHPIFNYGVYPERIETLIEHENREKPEQEMYKLLLFRCSLKVLINYDWDEDEKSTPGRKHYVESKRDLMRGLLMKYNKIALPEEGTKYLLIFGNRKESKAKEITWRAWVYDDQGTETQLQ